MSTDLQKYSTENQLDTIRRYAERRGYTIVRVFEDSGRSGLRIENRDGLQSLMLEVQSGNANFQAILVYDVSRWGRFQDADEGAYHEHVCSRAGIRVHYCGEQFDNDGSIGSILLKNVKRVMAGEYSRELSVKVFAGQCRAPDARSRNTIMNSIAPVWDGNETWLLLGGIGLLAAFPTAFAVIIPAVYFPILVMLLALVFRGLAFEFRFRDAENKTFWDHAFCYGSGIATFAQGVVLGAFIQGFPVRDGQFAGTSFAFLTPFSVLTGVALLFGYGLLGAGWLILKTEADIQAAARRQGRICLIGVVTAIAIVSIWTPIMSSAVAERWFTWPNIALFAPVPVLTGVIALATWRSLGSEAEATPFFGAIGLFVLAYAGMAISLFPMIVPHQLTLWEAASSPRTQAFLLVGTLFLLPVILTYSGWSYWVFRGKVRADVGYE